MNTPHKNNIISQLSPEDRSLLLAWCEELSYPEVVERAARPRPEGLAITTSTSALCRFYTQSNEINRVAEVSAQVARAIGKHGADEEGVFFFAILTTLEQAVFLAAAREKKPLEEWLPGIRAMLQMRRLRLSEEARAAKHPTGFPSGFSRDSAASFDAVESDQPEESSTPGSGSPTPPRDATVPEATGSPVEDHAITPRARRALGRGLSALLNLAEDEPSGPDTHSTPDSTNSTPFPP